MQKRITEAIFRQLPSISVLHGSHGYDQIVVEKFHDCLVSHVYSEFRCSCSEYWPDIMEVKCRNETSLSYQCFAISHYPISYSGSGRVNVFSYHSVKLH